METPSPPMPWRWIFHCPFKILCLNLGNMMNIANDLDSWVGKIKLCIICKIESRICNTGVTRVPVREK